MKVCDYLKSYKVYFRFFDVNYNFTNVTEFQKSGTYKISHDIQNTIIKKKHWNIGTYTKIIKSFG